MGSGSKGNALLVECGSTRLLVDAGLSARKLAERLHQIGVDPQSIAALLLTHEHNDHVSGMTTALKRWRWPVYASAGTLHNASDLLGAATTHAFTAGDRVEVGDLTVDTFRVSHDALEPCGFVVTSKRSGTRAAVLTDLGRASDAVRAAVARVDVLVVESNHDEGLLEAGPYPWQLKRRIAGAHGHLSNREAGDLAVGCVHKELRHVVLAHLSETNNSPSVAHEAMQRLLKRSRFRGALAIAPQHAVSGPFGDVGGVGGQLSLF